MLALYLRNRATFLYAHKDHPRCYDLFRLSLAVSKMLQQLLYIALVIGFLFSSSAFSIPPIFCETHADCISSSYLLTEDPYSLATRQLEGFQGALCDRGTCKSLIEGFPCPHPNSCGLSHSCLNGNCVLGGKGAPCSIDYENCMPGFTCDAATKQCVPGILGTKCRDKVECAFGNSCFFESPTPGEIWKLNQTWLPRVQIRGVCKPGVENTRNCARDNHCAKGLECLTEISLDAQTMDVPEACHANRDGAILSTWASFVLPGYRTVQHIQCLQCNASRNKGHGISGTCVRGVQGMTCYDQRECESGLVCGTSGKCAKSAEGQRCRSNFWCPSGALCRYNRCTFIRNFVPANTYLGVNRAKKCRWKTDCSYSESCRNGICLPLRLGLACSPRSYRSLTKCVNGIEVERQPGGQLFELGNLCV
eukprot:IDg22937t1